METVVLVIHLLLAVSLVGVILVQRSEGGGLGIGGSSGMGGMMTARGTTNLLTRTTAILAGCFFVTSITLAVIAARHHAPVSLIDTVPAGQPAAPESNAPAAPAVPVVPAAPPSAPAEPPGPAVPAAPSAPVSQ